MGSPKGLVRSVTMRQQIVCRETARLPCLSLCVNNQRVPKPILIITGDAGESYECLYARHRLLEAGLDAADRGAEPPAAASGHPRFRARLGHLRRAAGLRRRVGPDLRRGARRRLSRRCSCSAAARRSICGTTPRVLDIVRAFDAQEKWIFAICHGVQILAAAGIIARQARHGLRELPLGDRSGRRHLRHRRSGRPRRSHRHRPDLAVASRSSTGSFSTCLGRSLQSVARVDSTSRSMTRLPAARASTSRSRVRARSLVCLHGLGGGAHFFATLGSSAAGPLSHYCARLSRRRLQSAAVPVSPSTHSPTSSSSSSTGDGAPALS